MMRKSALRALNVCGLALSLMGCMFVDQFSDRAVEYNRQAEQAQEQMLLLNTLRAADRHPMQFTIVQNITGQAVVSGGSTISFPFGHRPNASAVRVFQLTDSVSGGPIFAVNVLDTQEFYDGLMNSNSAQMIDLYIAARYPREQILDLLIHKFQVFACDENKKPVSVEFDNTPADDLSFALYQAMIEHLLDEHGLNTERVTQQVTYGPPITKEVLDEHPDVPARTASAGLKIIPYKGEQPDKSQQGDCESDQSDPGNDSHTFTAPSTSDTESTSSDSTKDKKDLYQIVKETDDFRFCFDKSNKESRCGIKSKKVPANAHIAALAVPPRDIEHVLSLVAMVIEDVCKPSGPRTYQNAFSSRCKMPGNKRCSEYLIEQEEISSKQDSKQDTPLNAAIARVKSPTETQANACEEYIGKIVRMAKAAGAANKSSVSFTLKFYPRSTESAIYYLGEVARRWLHPDYDLEPRVIQIKFPRPGEAYSPAKPCPWGPTVTQSYSCENLFYVRKVPDTYDDSLAVSYGDIRYAIASSGGLNTPPNAPPDASYSTLELVKQLFALNLSAKQLPATTVLSVISPP